MGILRKRSATTDDGAVTVRVARNKKLYVAEVETKAGMRYSATHESPRQAEHEAFRLYVESKYDHAAVAEKQRKLKEAAKEHKARIEPTKE